MASRFRFSSVSSRVSGTGVAPASVVASRRWAWRSAFVSGGRSVGQVGGRFLFPSVSAACRAVHRLSCRRGDSVSLAVVLPCGCEGSAWSGRFHQRFRCSDCVSLLDWD